METHRDCLNCGKSFPDAFFRFQKGRPGNVCKGCLRIVRERSRKRNPERTRAAKKRSQEKVRMRRADPAFAYWCVFQNLRNYDRKHGLGCDITIEDVKSLTSGPCRYCGESEMRRCLDRIDNAKGHSLANVIPACARCNFARGSMPYEAWLFLTEGMRKARENGAFGTWTGEPKTRTAAGRTTRKSGN